MNRYVKMGKQDFTLLSPVLLLLFAIALFASACEPGGDLIIENQYNREVPIFYTHVRADGTLDKATRQGLVPPNTTKTFSITFLGSDWVQRIEAVDPSGEIVFSHDYRMDDLEKISWKITIPP